MIQALAMSITTARVKFTKLSKLFEKNNEAIQITKYGRPFMAVIPWDEYADLRETREILEDPQLLANLIKALYQAKKGKNMTAEMIRKKLDL